MKKVFALAVIFGLAACNGDDGEIEELDTDIELQQPVPADIGTDTMMMDTMAMDTMDTM